MLRCVIIYYYYSPLAAIVGGCQISNPNFVYIMFIYNITLTYDKLKTVKSGFSISDTGPAQQRCPDSQTPTALLSQQCISFYLVGVDTHCLKLVAPAM